MAQRVVFGTPAEAQRAHLHDVNWCEMATLAPLAVLVFWIGLFPNSLLTVMHASVNQLIEQVDRSDFSVAQGVSVIGHSSLVIGRKQGSAVMNQESLGTAEGLLHQ